MRQVGGFTWLTLEMDGGQEAPEARGHWDTGVVVLVGDPFVSSPLLDVGTSAALRSRRKP